MSDDVEKAEVNRLRWIADRMRGDRWMVERDDGGLHLIAFRASGETVILATFHKDAANYEVELVAAGAQLLYRFFDMFGRAREKVRELTAALDRLTAEKRKGDYTTQASMLLSDPRFWRFLETLGAGGPVGDKTAADTRLKSVLALKSKKQLNEDEAAKRAWLKLYADYLNWQKRG